MYNANNSKGNIFYFSKDLVQYGPVKRTREKQQNKFKKSTHFKILCGNEK